MAHPINSPSISPALLRSFEQARKATPLKNTENIAIASRLLRSLQYADRVTWNFLESFSDLTQESIHDAYIECRHFLFRDNGHSRAPRYDTLLQKLDGIFSQSWETLGRYGRDVSESSLLTAQTGLYFTRLLLEKNTNPSGNLIRLDTASPFLMLHVAAEILRDINRDVAQYKASFWPERTDLYSRLYNYCHDLHHIAPVGLAPQDADPVQLQDTLDTLHELDFMIQMTIEETDYLSVLTEQRSHLSVLQNYIAPFAKEAASSAPLPQEGLVLQWESLAPAARQLREQRAQRRASHPELIFTDPFIR